MTATTVAIPLAADADGVVRVGGTRVTLDTVVAAWQQGHTAETIADQYPTLRLADVYAVIGYYLDHAAEVNEYLRDRQQKAADGRTHNEAKFDPNGVRARLLARRAGGSP